MPLETRGAIGRYDGAREVLELHGAAKVPHWNRDQIAGMLGLPPSRVHLYEGHVGGGFGIRGELYPEDVLVCAAALRFRRPVKWIEDRREHLIAANHSRQQLHRIRAAIDAEGRILGIDDEFFHDQGAYVRTHAATVPDLAAAMLPGPYRVPAYRAVGHIRLTNKTPGGTYRAPGRFESTFVRERLLDAIAAKVGIDGVEVRRRNLIATAEMPYARPIETLGTHVTFDSGDYPALLDKTLAAMNWAELQADVQRRREAGEAVGVGLGMFVEKSGLGPFDGVRVTVDTSGAVEVVTGAASVGQGVETVIAQICADALGRRLSAHPGRARPDRPDRLWHGRLRLARDGHDRRGGAPRGARRFAPRPSRSRPNCCRPRRIRSISSMARWFAPVPAAGPSVALGEVARHLSPASKTLGGRSPGLTAEGWFHTDHMNYPYGVHAAVVQVDRETGAVKVLRYLVAYDIGKAVNPMLVEGQLAGGVAQGLGGALLEEFLYDDRGEPLSVTFRRLPHADVAGNSRGGGHHLGGRAKPAQSDGPEGRGRGRHQRGRRRDRRRDRRCHRHARRGHGASDHAAAAARAVAAERKVVSIARGTSALQTRHAQQRDPERPGTLTMGRPASQSDVGLAREVTMRPTANIAFAAVAFVLAAGFPAQAQNYPSQTIKIVVPFPPGGGVDVVARVIAPRLSEMLGQSVIVENRGGAGGSVGATYVAQSRARRLHAAARHRQHARNQPERLRQAALRSAARFRAGRLGHVGADLAGRQQRRAGEERRGPDRARQGQAGQGWRSARTATAAATT